MAERLTRQGLEVVLIDREMPGRGSTAASTAMLLWEIDRSLTELTELYGFEHAARCVRASFDAMNGLRRLIAQHGVACQMRPRQSLYLASGDTAKSLQNEFALRHRAGLPGEFSITRLCCELSISPAPAGRSSRPRPADADPVLLATGLLDPTRFKRGARLFAANATAFDSSGSRSASVSTTARD